MAVTTVAQLATELNRPAAALLEQFKSAGVAKKSAGETLTEATRSGCSGSCAARTAPSAPSARRSR